ncbi:UNVERIFIED_CONTAM: hypothetical protein GTU68_006724 [Idotea baltica]|nr:hypothetical protein [Idotea baltica]
MPYARLIITAINRHWLQHAVQEVCGYGSSVIGCDAEAGFEKWIKSADTMDGRPGASVLMFAMSTDKLKKAVVNRVGQCLMTCPTTAVFDGFDEKSAIPVGAPLRFFGDGFQKSKLIADRRFWRIPVMDGEFICEDKVGIARGVAGGNFLILSVDQISGLEAAERAVEKIKTLPGVITPFPGGVARSGSKVGSRYKSLVASTSHAYCPTLKGRVESMLPAEANCVYEIIIDGTNFDSVGTAIKLGIEAALEQNERIVAISAGNYGGELGKLHFHLRKLLDLSHALPKK